MLAELSGLDLEMFQARLDNDMNADLCDLSRLAEEMSLSASEMTNLAMAYVYERDLDSMRGIGDKWRIGAESISLRQDIGAFSPINCSGLGYGVWRSFL